MNDRELTRHLLTAAVAGLAALSIASTCPHRAATKERESHWDCRTCSGNLQHPWQPIPDSGTLQCKGHQHSWIMAWCMCYPGAICKPTGTLYPNQTWNETRVGTCSEGFCSQVSYDLTATGTLAGHETTGCGGS